MTCLVSSYHVLYTCTTCDAQIFYNADGGNDRDAEDEATDNSRDGDGEAGGGGGGGGGGGEEGKIEDDEDVIIEVYVC